MPISMTFAMLEGLQSEMQREKLLTLFYEYQTPSAVKRPLVRGQRGCGRFCARDVCQSRYGGGPLPPRRLRDSSKVSVCRLHVRTGNGVPANGGASRGVSSDQDRGLFGATRDVFQTLLAPVVEDEFNRGGQAFQAFFAGFPLAVGAGHLRAEGGEPFAVPLHNCGVAISDGAKLPRWRRTDNGKAGVRTLVALAWRLAASARAQQCTSEP